MKTLASIILCAAMLALAAGCGTVADQHGDFETLPHTWEIT